MTAYIFSTRILSLPESGEVSMFSMTWFSLLTNEWVQAILNTVTRAMWTKFYSNFKSAKKSLKDFAWLFKLKQNISGGEKFLACQFSLQHYITVPWVLICRPFKPHSQFSPIKHKEVPQNIRLFLGQSFNFWPHQPKSLGQLLGCRTAIPN